MIGSFSAAPDVRPRPGRAGYVLAAALLLLCAAASAAIVVFGVRHEVASVADLQRVDVPGSQQLYLDHPGSYTVYYETAGAPAG